VSGYSGTPLAAKLGIRTGTRLFVQGAPEGYTRLLAPLPAGVQWARRIDADTDLIHAFATRQAELARLLPRALAAMRADAALWVSWPKKAARMPTDISEDAIRTLALPLGLVDIKVCAVDETWSGLKLVIRKSRRPASGIRRRPAS
jgi:hypothetical protein